MKFALIDPPYFGLAEKFYGDIHPEAAVYDTLEGHAALIASLSEFDGWAMFLHEPSVRHILPLCPLSARLMPWVKPFCSYKPNVRVAYAHEYVIVDGGRPFEGREDDTVRDWVSANMTMMKGFPTAKPPKVIRWLLKVLNAQRGDEIVDMFPGSGIVTETVIEWQNGVKPKQLEMI